MPLFSDTASAIKSRFGFHDRASSSASSSSEMLTVKSTPDLSFKSAAKDVNALAVRSFSESGGVDDDDDKKITSAVRSFEFREDPNFWKEHNVQVIIRVRPLNSSEISLQGNSRCVKQDSSQTITWTGHPESRFTFDLVADENVSQEMLFKVAGVPMVENCMGGYNSCMFAYGQTGSGKTHTMLGDIEGGTRRHSVNCGMTPRVFEYLFSRIQKEKEARREEKIRYTCRCSFLEIYNEQILDLLDPSSLNLQIREDNKKGIYVENLTEIEVTSARDVIQQLLQGATNRKVAATNMNHASSRSHSVFTCTVESTWESQGVTHHRFARLNLVDLAGSERQKSSGAEGERLKEATNINKSLSTLGLVIMNLVNISNGKSLHVPYRDSKLTFLLQESLGGNAKTSIIANISPSSCCSLETLSTLKFAQRAKYIKNHAIVNEDASGDVLAMRIQIQNLKKEVSRLRSLVNGGAEHNEFDTLAAACPGSPGSFKWEGLQGLSSPLASAKKITHKKEYEVALVGAFRREKEKDIALKAMTAESQAASKLAKQREDEIKSLKMRLRFREAGIKRLEAIASGKISAETHLLKEREEHLKEIEVLSTQVDRNQEVTRFAMENLRLKEEIRRLKSFCEEGERERMNEQIVTLQNKLLEALDWKLMHESDPVIVQKENSELTAPSGDDFLLSSQASPWRTSMNEENEFLRMQAIQNQSELDSLHKKLNSCVEEKEKLQRHVNDLLTQLEVEKSSRAAEIEEAKTSGLHSLNKNQMPSTAPADQKELQTIVDAIAAASQREAEAHETAIFLSKENDELKMKLKVMIEDNNRLIELYEGAVEENHNGSKGARVTKEQRSEEETYHYHKDQEEHLQMEKEIDNLKHQLQEMHEENDKLMGLYEKAMQEKDELKRVVVSNEQNMNGMRVEFNCPEKLVVMYGVKESQSDENFSGAFFEECRESGDLDPADSSISCDAIDMPMETNLYEVSVEDGLCEVCLRRQDSAQTVGSPLRVDSVDNNQLEDGPQGLVDAAVINEPEASGMDILMVEASAEPQDAHFHSKTDSTSLHAAACLPEDLSLLRKKLVEAQEKLLDSSQIITTFALLEKAILEVNELSEEIERIESGSRVKQQEYASCKVLYYEMHEKKIILDRKLTALRYSLSNFSSSIKYFEQRERHARERMNASSASLNQKKEELVRIQVCKDETLAAQMKMKQSEVELKNEIARLKLKEEEETQRIDNERVLFAIENVEQTDNRSSQNWHFTGKATELLKSEEQKTKLQNQIKQSLEKLGATRKEIEEMNKKLRKLDLEIQSTKHEIENALPSVEELDHKVQSIINEKNMILDMEENGRNEFEAMILDYHQCLFETELKEEEIRVLEEDLQAESTKLDDLKRAKSEATSRTSNLLEEISCHSSCSVSEKLGESFHQITNSVEELNSFFSMITL
ncbi:OLC1v1004893C1 [Oldenlandia corymbosa var. corymbosa]|uniref:OLC1v1004893C1 n=1 Tax=Oldenlandia corymbosa var. corymbosa TaxID=529605 RepID=A0AAV1DGB1_OLDCO|nr:OLC1v1004893C1 [Oldenlandia corymbosa var. corymbosa]